MVFKSGSDDYDDDDDDDDDYEYENEEEASPVVTPPRTGPIGPGPGGPSGPPTHSDKPSQPEWAIDYRIDEDDGTAWAEAEDGSWYYWDNDNSEWSAWE